MFRFSVVFAVLFVFACTLVSAQDNPAVQPNPENLVQLVAQLQSELKELRRQNEDQRSMIARLTGGSQASAEAFVVLHPAIGQPVVERNAYVWDQHGRRHVWRSNGELVPVDIEYNHAPPKTMEVYYGSAKSTFTFPSRIDESAPQGASGQSGGGGNSGGPGTTINVN